MVIALLQLFVLRTTFLYALYGPLVDQRKIQIFVFGAGTLRDDADAVEIGGFGFGTIELCILWVGLWLTD